MSVSPHHKNKARRGFTLIELLVVIAIIALLAAILFPVFSRARENARKSSCANNLKQIALAATQYSQDFDEIVVTSWAGQNGGGIDNCNAYAAQAPGGACPLWMGLIHPYTKSNQIYQCPSAARINETNARNPQQTSYGHQHNNLGWGLNGNPSLADFGKTADTIYFSDSGIYLPTSSAAASWGTFLANPDTTNFSTNSSQVTRSYVQCVGCPAGGPYGLGPCCNAEAVVNRHLATCNVAFLDGHVKAMPVSKLTIPFFNASARGGPQDYWDRQ